MSHRFTRIAAIAGLAVLVAAAPAAAHRNSDRHHGGKKPLGTVASYADGTLTLTLTDGTTFTGAVAEDAQVKVEHRGRHDHGKGHKKHSNGSLEDLVAGTFVLRMKVEDDTLTKLRIRRAPLAEAPAAAEDTGDDSHDTTDDSGSDGSTDDAGSDDTTDDSGSDDSTDDSGSDDSTDGSADGEDVPTP